MSVRLKTILLTLLVSALAASLDGVAPLPAQAATTGDPTFVYFASEEFEGKDAKPYPPPNKGLENPCGLAVDLAGNFYVADYYHRTVSLFQTVGPQLPKGPSPYIGQVGDLDPLEGPCGLAVNGSGVIYVNSFHGGVRKVTPSSFPATIETKFKLGSVIDSLESTGVAVDAASNNVYVSHRSGVSVYDPAGSPLPSIGEPSIDDGSGIAISSFPGTAGRIYVADASTDTVKVFDPKTSTENPVSSISGPVGGFDSLEDSVIAVDRVSGDVYVADSVGSKLTEHPETVIRVFDSAGVPKGNLKYSVITGRPVGLAVDNSAAINQGRVYVTSGNSEDGSVYAYPAGSAIKAAPLPPVFNLSVRSLGSGSGAVTSSIGHLSCSDECRTEVNAAAKVTLAAEADPGSTFEGWSGAGCSGTEVCVIRMNEAAEVSAEFSAPGDNAAPAPTTDVAPAFSAPLATTFTGTYRASGHRTKHRHVKRHKQKKKKKKNHHRKEKKQR